MLDPTATVAAGDTIRLADLQATQRRVRLLDVVGLATGSLVELQGQLWELLRREEAFALARSNAEGRHTGAGTVRLGLDHEQRQRLRAALVSAEIRVGRRRRTWRPVPPGSTSFAR